MTFALLQIGDLNAAPGKQSQSATPQKQGQPPENDPLKLPMIFFLATGEADECGPGCREWIAAEGKIEAGTAQRLRAFLSKYPKLPPVFFHSPGGRGRESLAIGRVLRQRQAVVGIGVTVPKDCAIAADADCHKLKRSGNALGARLNAGGCYSACAYALAGGKIRQISPDATLGVHAIRFSMKSGKPVPGEVARMAGAKFGGELRSYLREVGVSPQLADIAERTPNSDIHRLTREEIAELGIDTRELVESRWVLRDSGNNQPYAAKFVVQARDAKRKAFRTSYLRFSCAGPYRVKIAILRDRSEHEAAGLNRVDVLFGTVKLALAPIDAQRKGAAADKRRAFEVAQDWVSYDALDEAMREGAIGVEERPISDSQASPRVLKLSVDGLAEGVRALRERCRASYTAAKTNEAL